MFNKKIFITNFFLQPDLQHLILFLYKELYLITIFNLFCKDNTKTNIKSIFAEKKL